MGGEISPCGRDDKEGAGMTKREVVEVGKVFAAPLSSGKTQSVPWRTLERMKLFQCFR
jgi:hypothetical protein